MTEAPKILVVEDDAIFGELIRSGFERVGWHTEVAMTGAEGLARAAEWKPDLLILDIILPDVTGFELLRRIKADKRTWQIPVIVLSNLDEEEDVRRGLDLGAADFLPKTKYNFTDVVARIKKFFRDGR
jgi:DNA-binding response OmpR family regulator